MHKQKNQSVYTSRALLWSVSQVMIIQTKNIFGGRARMDAALVFRIYIQQLILRKIVEPLNFPITFSSSHQNSIVFKSSFVPACYQDAVQAPTQQPILILILFPSSMRRNYRPTPKPEKQFIHTYHINEVPLPYYNPLEDPHLSGFFASRKVRGLIEQQGLLYSPRREYPYMNRRTKNAYKFHRDNSVDTPLSHQLRSSSDGTRSYMFSSQQDFREDDGYRSAPLSPISPQLKKRAESEILQGNKIPSLSQILSRRPSTQSNRRRIIVSSEGKARTRIFQSKSFSSNKMGRKNPEND